MPARIVRSCCGFPKPASQKSQPNCMAASNDDPASYHEVITEETPSNTCSNGIAK